MYPCPKCNATGQLPHFNHIDDGVCYMCDGTTQVENKPEIHINDESCTAIHRLRLDEGEQYYIATFYVWEDDGRKYANTGHWHIDLIDPTEVEDFPEGPVYKETSILKIEDNTYHCPLWHVREQYRVLQQMGYKPVPYHPSLYGPEPL